MNKNWLKSLIYGFEVRCSAAIGNGLVHRASKQQTLRVMRKELELLRKYTNLSDSETNDLWLDCYGRYVRVSKQSFSGLRRAVLVDKRDKTYEEALKLRKNIVYESLRKEFPQLEKQKNWIADQVEYRAKRDNLDEILRSGIFYLCSTHIKPAKDHADWEGKIYVSADWQIRIDEELHGKIAAYIRNHDVKTVEWVTGEPVYLVTRPNCKHYLIEVSVEEVLGNSVKSLLRKHNLYIPDEEPMSYDYTQYKGYYERLKMLTYMKKMFDAENMEKDIRHTRALMLKWKGKFSN